MSDVVKNRGPLNALADEMFATALKSGWYTDGDRNFGEIVALCHSELSEALEEWRKGYAPDYVYYRESDGKPEGMAMEMADTLIRVLDWFAANGIDVDATVREKMEFNKTRSFRHGGKIA